MNRPRRHPSTLRAMLVAALIWFALSFPTLAQLRFNAEPLLGEASWTHRFSPIRVSLQTTAPFRGQIVAYCDNSAASRVVIPVNVGAGSFSYEIAVQQFYTAYQYQSPTKVMVQLRAPRQRPRKIEIPIRNFAVNYSGYYRKTVLLGWFGKTTLKDLEGKRFMDFATFTSVKPPNCPRNGHLYEALDALLVAGSFASPIDQEQIDAIDTWVRTGGHLVFGSRSLEHERFSATDPLLKHFGVTLGDTARLHDLTATLKLPDPNQNRNYQPKLEAREVDYKAQIRSIAIEDIASTGPDSLAVTMPYGFGAITLTCVDLDQLLQDNTEYGAELLLNRILEDRFFDSTPVLNDTAYLNASNLSNGWTDSLRLMTNLERIPRGLVFLFLVLFCILVCPVERVILKRRNLHHWTWGVTAATVAVFCLLASLLSIGVRGTKSRRVTIGLHDYLPDRGGRHNFFECFTPARSRSFIAQLSDDEVLLEATGPNNPASATVNALAGSVELATPVWAHRFLQSRRSHQEPAPFEVGVTATGDAITATVRPTQPGLEIQRAVLHLTHGAYPLTASNGVWVANGTASKIKPDTSHKNQDGRPVWDREHAKGAFYFWLNQLHAVSEERWHADQFFHPFPQSAPWLDETTALLVAECNQGPEFGLDAPKAKVKRVHFVRQLISIERK